MAGCKFDKTMRRVRNIVNYVFVALLLAVATATTAQAQIRIIPRTKIDSARNVATTDVGLRFVGGTTVDFGTITEDGGAWHGEIEWRNVGEKPITITRISTSCGCLKAESRTTELTARGGRNKLQITYFPQGHAGTVSQRIFVYTDRSGQQPAAVVVLQGRVLAAADSSGDYAENCGPLLLRRKWVRFAGEGEQIERIACMNGGQKPLKITADTLLSTRGVSAHTEPEILQAGEAGDLIIRYSPREDRWSKVRPRLFLSGVELAPRERMIELYLAPEENERSQSNGANGWRENEMKKDKNRDKR